MQEQKISFLFFVISTPVAPQEIVLKDVPLAQVYISLFADEVGIAAPDTLNTGQGVHNLLLAIDVGIKQSQNELEIGLLARYERYWES
jgi:hypothetical protein